MPKLLYQGHASWRITSDEGIVIFIDPYCGEGYSKPADLVLVTHNHYDHNATHLINFKADTVLVYPKDVLVNGNYTSMVIHSIKITATPAYNSHHDRSECVGYIIEVDGVRIYHSGDTDLIDEMKDLAKKEIDYALLPIDGFYTMSPEAASRCAEIIGCRHMIPMHMHPGLSFDMAQAMKVTAPQAMLVRPMQEIELEKKR